jgi:hypothetical protein
MSVECLHSIHLEFPRRDEFRRARQTLLDARGGLTWAAERLCQAADIDHWQSLFPSDLGIAAFPWLLIDRRTGHAWPLKVGLNRIGRFDDNDIVVDDRSISRRHCVILVHAGGSCELHDTASRNGTYRNGRRLTGPAVLAAGDVIRLARREFCLVDPANLRPGKASDPTHDTVVEV